MSSHTCLATCARTRNAVGDAYMMAVAPQMEGQERPSQAGDEIRNFTLAGNLLDWQFD